MHPANTQYARFHKFAVFGGVCCNDTNDGHTGPHDFSGVGGAKEKKTYSTIDKIIKSANNFYNKKVTTEGRGRFPGQLKHDQPFPTDSKYTDELQLINDLESFETFESSVASNWASVFGTNHPQAPTPDGSSLNTSTAGAKEFLNGFGGNAVKSPFQDGHYIYSVVAGGGEGQSSYAPVLFVADLESPKNFYKKLQP